MELDYKDQLTNEKLLKRFNNQFELVRYAIQVAENTIRSGRELDIWADSQNVSYLILSEIAANKEEFVEIPEVIVAPVAAKVESFKEEKSERKTKTKRKAESE
ncbi:MAG: hypothetical protein JSR37_05125 [Verrucomicrobia bacterium]|nr:hypothetical protein [Verrucomicrobiota bacterium]MBS0637470.1 hypothetical protein [Verrucomicrobiota bacterium]